ncbi:GNAT family N-acetyltransferase [Microbispora sp. RL4-1S]|uniref:GNAT family N-acetyltransferase n=1 Tax=Microbispora oryzae TaxID=2806554 RepID=A0A941AJI8_9ACTN|nr:GNAT family N-acetyltransferase [Microbispora oryzae]MBP2704248.1 GNAT family N-acetyltransferase [Microbispora oryzae]
MGGTPGITVRTRSDLPDLSWSDELRDLTDASPFLGPAWLAAQQKAAPELIPFHTVATRGTGEVAVLPGYLVGDSGDADLDPRSYLGHDADVFPALVLGSPEAYRTEIAFNFWTPALAKTMIDAVVAEARAAGARSVVAPWIAEGPGSGSLVEALDGHGAGRAFWAVEDYVPLNQESWDAHLAALPKKTRYRLREDAQRADELGVEIRRFDGEMISPQLTRIAELITRTQRKHGTPTTRIDVLIQGLIDAGVTVRAYAGIRDGVIVSASVAVRKGRKLYVKWSGTDDAALGERSGVYFPVTFVTAIRDGYAEGLRVVAFGAGSHRAKALRGSHSREITTSLLVLDEELRPDAVEWLHATGEARRRIYEASRPTPEIDETDAVTPSRTLPLFAAEAGGGCCSNG